MENLAMQKELFDNPKIRTRSRIEKLLDYAERFGHYTQLVDGCCEPGYDDKPVVLGNWNSETRWDGEKRITVNNVMPRIAKLLEKLGYEVEWEDEWTTCEDCGKATRSQPDSYSWQPSYAIIGELRFFVMRVSRPLPLITLPSYPATRENA